MEEVRKLKHLQSMLKVHKAKKEDLLEEVRVKQRELSAQEKIIKDLKDQISKLDGRAGLKVSEHAILRYLERSEGLDIEEIEKKILTEELVNLTEKLGGSGTYPIGDVQAVLKNNTVVTIK